MPALHSIPAQALKRRKSLHTVGNNTIWVRANKPAVPIFFFRLASLSAVKTAIAAADRLISFLSLPASMKPISSCTGPTAEASQISASKPVATITGLRQNSTSTFQEGFSGSAQDPNLSVVYDIRSMLGSEDLTLFQSSLFDSIISLCQLCQQSHSLSLSPTSVIGFQSRCDCGNGSLRQGCILIFRTACGGVTQ